MRYSGFRFRLAFGLVLLVLSAPMARAQVVLNVTLPGAQASGTGQIGGGFKVTQAFVGAAGSGNIGTFLRIQSNDDSEQGYNPNDGSTPMDVKNLPGSGIEPLRLSDIPLVFIGGVFYREFLLDANQSSNGPISLNQVQIFQSRSALGSSGTATPSSATADAVVSFSSGSPTEVFRLNNARNNGLNLAANYEIWVDSGHGSGTGDMFLYVPNLNFNQDASSLITLYSQFGSPGQYETNDGFEEWAVRQGVASVPEPSTWMLSAAALSFGVAWQQLRRGRRSAA